MVELPIEYQNRMKKILGDSYSDYINELENSPVKAFRVNTEKISMEDFIKINPFGSVPVPYADNSFYLDYDGVGNHPYHHAGMIYVQEPGAMIPAECVEVKSDWKILDMCAAPGGKSTQLKSKLGSDGVLVSNEIISSRCKILTGNVERLGLKNVVTTCLDSEKIAKNFPKTFDLVMVDAPCSGEGMFRKEAIAIKEWSEENVLNCAKRQKMILSNASKCVKNGGYIIYATCTFSLEENEMVIDDFLFNNPDFVIVDVPEKIKKHTLSGINFDGAKCDKLNYTRRFYPHLSRGEGQFVAVLKNVLDGDNLSDKKPNVVKIDNTVTTFLRDTLKDFDIKNVKYYNGNPVIYNDKIHIKDGLAFSCGVTIGEVKKNYLLPHHQFFMAMGDSFINKIELDKNSEQLKSYLHGEEFLVDIKNGYAVVMVDGCAVGGVKVVSSVAKNHYPKGLRTLKKI